MVGTLSPRNFGVVLEADLPAHRGTPQQQQAAPPERLPLLDRNEVHRIHAREKIAYDHKKSTIYLHKGKRA